MRRAAVFTIEDFQLLVLGTDDGKHLLGVVERNLLVLAAVRDQERAGDPVPDRRELKIPDVMERGLHRLGAGDVGELEGGRGARAGHGEPAMPDRVVVVVRAPRHDRLEPRLEGSRAHDGVATEAAGTDPDARNADYPA